MGKNIEDFSLALFDGIRCNCVRLESLTYVRIALAAERSWG